MVFAPGLSFQTSVFEESMNMQIKKNLITSDETLVIFNWCFTGFPKSTHDEIFPIFSHDLFAALSLISFILLRTSFLVQL